MVKHCLKPSHRNEPCGVTIGRRGENEATLIIFDISEFVEKFGDGRAEMVRKMPNAKTVYPVTLTREGNKVNWLVTSADTSKAGSSDMELRWYVNDVLAKSAIIRTSVLPALTDVPGDAPDPVEDWIDAKSAEIAELIESIRYLDDPDATLAIVREYVYSKAESDKQLDFIKRYIASYEKYVIGKENLLGDTTWTYDKAIGWLDGVVYDRDGRKISDHISVNRLTKYKLIITPGAYVTVYEYFSGTPFYNTTIIDGDRDGILEYNTGNDTRSMRLECDNTTDVLAIVDVSLFEMIKAKADATSIYSKAEVDSRLRGYVKSDTVPTASTAGPIKVSSSYNTAVTSAGVLYGITNNLADYKSRVNGALVSKGTLENVLAPEREKAEYTLQLLKDLTKRFDALVGGI